jgi:hypothetical protein
MSDTQHSDVKPLPPSTGSALQWERFQDRADTLRGFLPAKPETTLFLIDISPSDQHRGTMRGAFIPDEEDAREWNENALIVGLKCSAEIYMREWIECYLSQNVKGEARPSEQPERKAIGIEIADQWCDVSQDRVRQDVLFTGCQEENTEHTDVSR